MGYFIKTASRIGKYLLIEIDRPIEEKSYSKYRINNRDYDIVPVYDLPNHVAVMTEDNIKEGELQVI